MVTKTIGRALISSIAPMGAGIEDFRRLREKGYEYVDKTLLIKRFLDNPCTAALFTRPRRFGKTLALSMLRHFFEIGTDPAIFEGLEIMRYKVLVEEHMGKYPVISISLKDVHGATMQIARGNLAYAIRKEANRLGFLENSSALSNAAKEEYRRLSTVEGNDVRLHESLALLLDLLEKHFSKQAILLIDEYDVPLEKSWHEGYYDEMLGFIRLLFNLALKGNNSLEFAILTGCLRVSKENIFTGVNNFRPFGISHPRYASCFGFTESETESLLESRGLLHRISEVREWYNGYNFAGTKIYCPWDIVSFCDDAYDNPSAQLQPYWMNTSENAIVKQLADIAGQSARNDIGTLIDGGVIAKKINEQLSYSEIGNSIENVWSVMHATGYLTARRAIEGGKQELAIPNESVRLIFAEQIEEWFKIRVAANTAAISAMQHAFANGDGIAAEAAANELLADFISSRDYSSKEASKESFYHGLLLGALADMQGWHVTSNSESGFGFWDIAARRVVYKSQAFAIEIKYARSEEALKEASEAAIKQIEDRQYWRRMEREGASSIWLFGAAFYKKHCCISSKQLELR
ncbi:MAG: ATP-binding protein [Eubacteriaceae bacterium]|nr:ATP-binding protein [Eubacteriaceae bacterium]